MIDRLYLKALSYSESRLLFPKIVLTSIFQGSSTHDLERKENKRSFCGLSCTYSWGLLALAFPCLSQIAENWGPEKSIVSSMYATLESFTSPESPGHLLITLLITAIHVTNRETQELTA